MNLSEIRDQLKAPKNQFNSFGKYYYRSCEDILEAVKPLLGDSQLIISDEVIQVGVFNYVKARVWFKEPDTVNKSGELVSQGAEYVVTGYAREPQERKGMDPSQMSGMASSYARKYALNGMFLIDDAKDADTNEGTALRNKKSKPAASGSKEIQYEPVDDLQI